MKNIKILWTQPTKSGLGDRCCDLLFVYAYAAMLNGELYTDWPEFEIKDRDTSHRKLDIQLCNILKYIKFPEKIHFTKANDSKGMDILFDFYVGGGLSLESFYNKYVEKRFSLTEFEVSVKNASQQFEFSQEVNDYLSNLPKSFASLHVRRGDKVRKGNWNDGYFINDNELEHLDSITIKAIDMYYNLGYKYLFICGDEDEKKKPFIDYANSKNLKTFVTPEMPKWIETYFDIATMSKSDMIVASQRHSSFAKFPSLISNCKFFTVFDLEQFKLI